MEIAKGMASMTIAENGEDQQGGSEAVFPPAGSDAQGGEVDQGEQEEDKEGDQKEKKQRRPKLPPKGGNNNNNNGGNKKKSFSTKKLPSFTEGRKILAVAGSSPVKQVAGSIAHTSRESNPPVLSAVGPASVNQAVKAVAIARSYLEGDQIDLVVEVQRGESGGDIKDLILLNLKKVTVRVPPKTIEHVNLKSAGRSGTSQLAGAIAKNVRENKRVKITAVGQNPVFRAVDSIVFARKYLTDDGVDLEFQPQFTHVTFSNGTEANAIELLVLTHQV